jgi:hypothetical protein
MKGRILERKGFLLAMVIFIIFVASGCGTVVHTLDLQNNYVPQADTKIEVGPVTNGTGEKFDIDIEYMLATALTNKLREKELMWDGKEGPKLTAKCKIVEYKKGDAFKRWLMPGWGSTVLAVTCDLADSNNVVGIINARRTVDAGGGYTIGAWQTVFGQLAMDIADDVQTHIRKNNISTTPEPKP